MIDEIDLSADRAEHERQTLIENHRNRPVPKVLVEQCIECGSAISAERSAWGAVRCVPCASVAEGARR